MLSWSSRRRLLYFSIAVAVILVIIAFPAFLYLTRPGSCFDGAQNNEEDGIDCGGVCDHLCSFQAVDVVTRWSRIISVRDGIYDAVALVENPNFNAGVRDIAYVFKLYEENASLIGERRGSTFINPNEQFAVFESGIATGSKIPSRITFEFKEEPYWLRAKNQKPDLLVRNRVIENLEIRPRLRATLVNQSLDQLREIFVTGLLLNRGENVVAVSSTIVEDLAPNNSQDIVFTWPAPFIEKPEVCVNPLDTMMVFDRSGSMNDDGNNQPLADARVAAGIFVDKLGLLDQVGLVTFATHARDPVDHMLSGNLKNVRDAISAITIEPADEVGFTNLSEAIERATFELNSTRHNILAKKVMVILTDGLPTAPGSISEAEAYAEEKAAQARGYGITLYAIGLGEAVNAEFLAGKIASGRSRYYAAPRRSDLIRIYNEIALAVCPDKTYLITIFPRTNTMEQ